MFCVQFVGVVGGAVSLLLVFRTNAAFGRFCAAADSFAEVLSATRNLSRKMAVWAPVSHRVENARLCAAIPWAVKHRGQVRTPDLIAVNNAQLRICRRSPLV